MSQLILPIMITGENKSMAVKAARTSTKPTASGLLDAKLCWDAIVARDRASDGRFYYSVATSGVYCHPSCPSRRPNRENVSFHASCADAEAAGFRACRRCKPNDPPLAIQYAQIVCDACRMIEANDEQLALEDLAQRIGLSPYHFHRVFKAVAGVTPKAYAAAHRQQRVRENLTRSTSVTGAIHESGFNSSGRFYAQSNAVLGMTPGDFRKGGANANISFAIGESTLGSILVAASGKGVAAILLGDDPDTLIRDLQNRFPKATLIGGDRAFETTVAKAVGLVEGAVTSLGLPLDIQGTAFQHRVWQELQKIPSGDTATYSEIADRIGMPKAARAVASACAANTIAVAIPCHRVIARGGALSGYRWGVERKRALLIREARKSGK